MTQNTVWTFTIGRDLPIVVAATIPHIDSTRILELEQDLDAWLVNQVPRQKLYEDPIYYVRAFFQRNGYNPEVCFPIQYAL